MDEPKEITAALANIQDAHGYGFQYAVLALARKIFDPRLFGGSCWQSPDAEFPVEVNGAPYHADLILEHCRRPMFLVGECKRANPALRNWCFLRAPFREADTLSSQVFAEQLAWSLTGSPFCRLTTLFPSQDIYHLGIEVKSNEKGNPCDKGRGAIEEAATQALRGTNGLVEFLKGSPKAREEKRPYQLIPVIFTTARLWATQADLAAADLRTGKLDLSSCPVEEKPYVFLHYSQSPGLKHSLATAGDNRNDGLLIDALYTDYVRTVAIVNAGGIERFLRINYWSV